MHTTERRVHTTERCHTGAHHVLVPQVPPPLALSPPPPSPPALAKAITIEEPGSRLGIRTSDAADSGPKDKRIVFALLLFATIGVFTLAVKGAFAPRSRRGCIGIRKSGRRGRRL